MSESQAKVKELWGEKFSIVPHGLAEDQVVAYVNRLLEHSKRRESAEERQSTLLKLAEQTVIEADKLAASIKAQAKKEAEEEKARIVAQAADKAREEGQKIIKAAEDEASTRASKIVSKAEQDAQEIIERAQKRAQDILQAASEKAASIESEAKVEAEYAVRHMTTKLAHELRAAVTGVCNQMLSGLDVWEGDKVAQQETTNGKTSHEAMPEPHRVTSRPSAKK